MVEPELEHFRSFSLAKEPERREKATMIISIYGNAGYGKSCLVNVLLKNRLNCDGSLVMRTRTLVFVVKPGVPTDDDAICSSPATTCNTQYLCNVLKYWKQEIDPALAFLWERELPHNHWQDVLLPSLIPKFVYHEDMPSNSPRAKLKLISGVYSSDRGNSSIQVFKMEHSALQGPNSQWNLEVKYKERENKASAKRWVNIWNFYPDAKVELKRNETELTISSPNENHEFAVFGTPEKEDKKRMQIGIFGGKPKQGKHWQIFVTLFDDTMMAFKRVCEREESKGRQLLTTLAGLFVSNSNEDITIDITALEDGWKIIGSHFMTIKSKDAWNSPENSTDFPCCVFEIAHVDKTKQTFLCGIQASHLNDTAKTKLLALFEQEQENKEHLNGQNLIPPQELIITGDDFIEKAVYEALEYLVPRERFKKPKISFTDGKIRDLYDLPLRWKQAQTEAFVLFLMLVPFVTCLTGTPFVPPHLLKVEETEASLRTLGE